MTEMADLFVQPVLDGTDSNNGDLLSSEQIEELSLPNNIQQVTENEHSEDDHCNTAVELQNEGEQLRNILQVTENEQHAEDYQSTNLTSGPEEEQLRNIVQVTENEHQIRNIHNNASLEIDNEGEHLGDNLSREQEHITETISIHSVQSNNHIEQRDIAGVENVKKCTEAKDHESEFGKEKQEIPKDITRFFEDMYDLLECPVCLNHMTPPILLCESGHNICFKCRPFMTKCPLCRGPFLKTRNVALEVIARKMVLSHEGCKKENTSLQEEHELGPLMNQVTYTCPFTLFTNCYWQGQYSDIKMHMEEIHTSKILGNGLSTAWEMKLVVKDLKVMFALNEIFFYKERLDTRNSKFYIQVFYVGNRENHSQFSYHLEISSQSGQQRYAVSNVTLPIEDLEHTYTYSHSHCTVLDYTTISSMSKHGDMKCMLSIERISRE